MSYIYLRWLIASIHLIGFGIAIGSVFARGMALRRISGEGAVGRVLTADNFWGLSALILISTGLFRAFGGFEKGSDYYLGSTLFWIKMALLVTVLALEIRPMVQLIRWRREMQAKRAVDTSSAPQFARISYVQTGLVTAMLVVAAAMARGMDI